MEEKKLTHDESLQIIQSMILTAKNQITENGFHFLLWGILVILASISEFVIQLKGFNNLSQISWMVMPAIGIPIAFIYEYKKNRGTKTRGHVQAWLAFLWLGFLITLGITIFASVAHHLSPIPYILALVGFATFVSGSIYKFYPLIIGGIIFWVAASICVLFDGPEQLIVNAIATFFGYIVPGILLWKKSKTKIDV